MEITYADLKRLGLIDYSQLEGRLINYESNDGIILEVVGCDPDIGMTLQATERSVSPVDISYIGREFLCLNGPSSPNESTPEEYYERCFDYMVERVLLHGSFSPDGFESARAGKPASHRHGFAQLDCAFSA